MRARVTVRLKDGVLDPQGEAIRQALLSLGFSSVGSVRVGKVIDIELPGSGTAQADVAAMVDQLLVNPVIEDASVEVLS